MDASTASATPQGTGRRFPNVVPGALSRRSRGHWYVHTRQGKTQAYGIGTTLLSLLQLL